VVVERADPPELGGPPRPVPVAVRPAREDGREAAASEGLIGLADSNPVVVDHRGDGVPVADGAGVTFQALVVAATDPATDYISLLLTWGPGGLVVALFLSGLIETKRNVTDLKNERGEWRKAFETEREGHQKTRESLAKAEERADAALEAARTTQRLLESLGHSVNPGGTGRITP
jgi:hypothetical protein